MTKIHFECSPSTRPSMQFTAESVRAVLGPELDGLEGIELSFNDNPDRSDRYLADADVLVVSNPVDLSGLDRRAPRLRWVQVMSAGVEKVVGHIPGDVMLTNVRGAHSARAGEFAIAALLMLNNRIPTFATQQHQHLWKPSPQAVVAGKTVAILGLGALGGAAAKWARAFDMHVIGITRSGKPHENTQEVLPIEEMRKAFRRSDFVLIALPLTPETKGLVSREALDCLPPHAGVINIGRADVMDYRALTDKLRDGTLSGAILDVFYEEPLPETSEIWSVPNLLVTPHSALDDPSDFGVKCLQVFGRNLSAYCANRPLETPVNKTLGY